MQPQAFIYCRISQDRDGTLLGVTRQSEDSKKLASEMGYSIAKVFTDNDTSAYSGKPRPAYGKMLAALQKGEASAVFCWHTDRLHRSAVELEAYIDVCEAHSVETFTVKSGRVDLSTATGRMLARLLGATAVYESDQKGARAKRKMEELLRKGKWTGGTRPFGWQIANGQPVLDATEAEAVKAACEAVLAGKSLGSIVRSLNERGITTVTGRLWNYAPLRQVLLRPRNAGLAAFHGEIVGPSEFPAIVSEDVYRAVVSTITDPGRRRSQTNKARHLLAGIAQCHCGEVVRSATVGPKGQSHFVYRCPASGSGHVGKRIDLVDDVVNRRVIAFRQMLATSRAIEGDDGERRDLETEAEALRTRLQDAASLAANGLISLDQMVTMSEGIRAKQAILEARMIELTTDTGLPEAGVIQVTTPAAVDMDSSDATAWLNLPVDDRRDYVRRNFHIVLFPHSTGSPKIFDRATVVVRPRARGSRRGPMLSSEIGDFRRGPKVSFDEPSTPKQT